MNDASPNDQQDAAWVTIETPFGVDWLKDFIGDIERLYRINSQIEFEEMRQIADDAYVLKGKNLSNGKNIDQILTVTPEPTGVRVTYSSGLKTFTSFQIETKPDGSSALVITDDYSGVSQEEREARIEEVDKSLVQWGRDIHRYLRQWKRWSWIPGWQYYMRRFWQTMKPMARRICYMLLLITIVEFVVFLMVFTIFWLELDKYVG
jgi:hypothetical protein